MANTTTPDILLYPDVTDYVIRIGEDGSESNALLGALADYRFKNIDPAAAKADLSDDNALGFDLIMVDTPHE